MIIRSYCGKKVLITADEQEKFAGVVVDYVFPEDNNPEGESIIIRSIDGQLIEFRPEEIKAIEEIR